MKINYVSYNQLIKDATDLARSLPRNYSHIIAISRSGYIPAAVIGFHLNLPVCTADDFLRGTFSVSNRIKLQPYEKLLIVDDSISSGTTLRQIENKLKGYDYHTAAIYTDREDESRLDYFVKVIPGPRVFEWNTMNHGHLATAGVDFDGVLCKDPKFVENDKTPEITREVYLNAEPLHLPQQKIFAIVTNRLECFRLECEIWLEKYGVKYDHLIMSPFEMATERRNDAAKRGGNGFKKGLQAKELGCKWFIESDLQQAKQIKSILNSSVFCADIMEFV